MKRLILIVVAVAIIAGGIYFWKTRSGNQKADDQKTKTVAVQRGAIMRNVQATGIVASRLDVEIKCKASGEIITLPFDISAGVKKGDLLIELDPTDEERNVRKSRVSLIQSQARLDQSFSDLSTTEQGLSNSKQAAKVNLDTAKIKTEDARSKEDRVKQLYERKLASREELDTAHTSAVQAQADYDQAQLKIDQLKTQEESLEMKRQALKIAKADVESAKINLSIAEQRLKETKVFSPTDGVITALNAQTGQIISSGINNVGGGTSIMTVSDMSSLYILAAIDESDIGDVVEGQQVIVTADAYPKQAFRGVVDRIAQKGQSVSNVVTFEVRIEVASDNKAMLKPEMTANVEIVIEKKDDVLYVPVGAVFNEDQKQAGEAAAKGNGGSKVATPASADGSGLRSETSSPGRSGRPGGAFSAERGGRSDGVSSGQRRTRPEGEAGMAGAPGMRKLKQYVTVVNSDGTTEVREIETGMTDGENIEIVSGLKEGEIVETKEDSVQSRWNSSNRRGGPRGPMGMMH